MRVGVTVTALHRLGVTADDVVALALEVAMEVVVGIFPPVSWFAIFAITAGQRIYVGHLGNLAPSRTSTCPGIIILGSHVALDLFSL
ncbi:SC35-like splicing factor 33 [Prunus dulcis]|uniref:SC35-like splicing factor 33 n=1 Tax=Prunus dulcis TaxID=3755 RepID=A0A4Y1RUG3_PRUDU|nr:SC35-like splicing factor 33 [Prunus dulcis]